jgi:hypothetical protein
MAELFKASSDADELLSAGIKRPVVIEASLSKDSSALLARVRSAALSAMAATSLAPEACGLAKGGGERVDAASNRAEAAATDEVEEEEREEKDEEARVVVFFKIPENTFGIISNVRICCTFSREIKKRVDVSKKGGILDFLFS